MKDRSMDMRHVPPRDGEAYRVMAMDPEALHTLCRITPYPLFLVDDQASIVMANQRASCLFGYHEDQLVGQPVELLVPETFRPTHRGKRQAYLDETEPRRIRVREGLDVLARRVDGGLIPVEVALVPVETVRGRAVIVSVIDLRQRKDLEARLRDERDFSEAIIDSLPGLFYLLDREGRFLRWNRNVERVTGATPDELVRLPAWSLFRDRDAVRVRNAIETVFRDGVHEIDAELNTRTETSVPYHFTGRRVELAGKECLTGAGVEISTRKGLEEQLRYQANHDSLTGLVNRHHFEELLRQEFARSQRSGTVFSVAMMDIDHFKKVNDHYGHLTGDQVLRDFRKALQARVRATDTLARWGGEEFVLLLPETDATGGASLAEVVRARVEETPMPGPGRITVSLAVTAHRRGESPNELLNRLDKGLYEAKRAGRNRVVAC
jgi:diguanylate cyclase (GGDEF)-like protein/PAS domain S-box-containing protein